mmetsp:Transcript_35600/g.42874  ORF Transcript_35600/g.42874 Transcript_35600/m.42874 type:complete len:298 (-) Transcript_35600:706-1599(-)|eukprot:CAMPEP_0197851910 /NCGR_PEP_ID=MMETSP1438-20131217/19215_1 /TAXON_ID=1461541 /ORGANISM="Pterosperma sp., Strain CCMP1384" /LENGTH=297 /DNA_ID=CAMNT_0043465709 /DNA_START=164 /DNA_END=1060 /DNA_ORIENTATION=+
MVTEHTSPPPKPCYAFSTLPLETSHRICFKETSVDDLEGLLTAVTAAKQRSVRGQESRVDGLDLSAHPELQGPQFLTSKTLNEGDFSSPDDSGSYTPTRVTLSQGVDKLASVVPSGPEGHTSKVDVLSGAFNHILSLEAQVENLKNQLSAAGLAVTEPPCPQQDTTFWERAGGSRFGAERRLTDLYTCQDYRNPVCSGKHADKALVHAARDNGLVLKVCAQSRPGLLSEILQLLKKHPVDIFETEFITSSANHCLNVFQLRVTKGGSITAAQLQKEVQAALAEAAPASHPQCPPASA